MSLFTPELKAQVFGGLVDNLDGTNQKLGRLIDVKCDEAEIGVDKQKLEMFDAIGERIEHCKATGGDGGTLARLGRWQDKYSG